MPPIEPTLVGRLRNCPIGWKRLSLLDADPLVCEYVGLTWEQCMAHCSKCEGEWPVLILKAEGCSS